MIAELIRRVLEKTGPTVGDVHVPVAEAPRKRRRRRVAVVLKNVATQPREPAGAPGGIGGQFAAAPGGAGWRSPMVAGGQEHNFDQWYDTYGADRVQRPVDVSDAEAQAFVDEHVRGAEVWMRVPSKKVSTLLKEGEWKNIHDGVKSTKGAGDRQGYASARKSLEDALFGDGQPAPFYGYLTKHQDGFPPSRFSSSALDSYGTVAVRLKRARVENDTTWTDGDSLNENTAVSWRAPFGEDPEAVRARRASRGGAGSSIPSSITNPQGYTMSRHRRVAGHADRATRLQPEYSDYFEAQLHKRPTVDDIEEVVFSDPDDAARLGPKLKKRGIPFRMRTPT